MTDRIFFEIDWDTGYVVVEISSFFVEASTARVKKLCRLARQYSSEEKRKELLTGLAQEDEKRKALLDKLTNLACLKTKQANSFFHTNAKPEQGWAEKRLIQERATLARVIDIIKAERWE